MALLKIGIEAAALFDAKKTIKLIREGSHRPGESFLKESPVGCLIELLNEMEGIEVVFIADAFFGIPEAFYEQIQQQGYRLMWRGFDNWDDWYQRIYGEGFGLYLAGDDRKLMGVPPYGFIGAYITRFRPSTPYCEVALDYRLFKNRADAQVLGILIQLLGWLQQACGLTVNLVTSSQSSVDPWARELFAAGGCRIDETWFLASGGKNEIMDLFAPSLYFEGSWREEPEPFSSQTQAVLYI